MKNWAKQLAGAVLVLAFALAVGGFVMVLRAQQGGLAATMAAAHIRAVSPPDGATNAPVDGEIRAVVGQVTGITVEGFSWDGSLVAGGIQGNSGLTGAEVIRWQNHQVVWNRCACPSPFAVRVIAQPEGGRLAVGAFDQHAVGTLTIVDGSGVALTVPVGNQPFLPLF